MWKKVVIQTISLLGLGSLNNRQRYFGLGGLTLVGCQISTQALSLSLSLSFLNRIGEENKWKKLVSQDKDRERLTNYHYCQKRLGLRNSNSICYH